ncbi:polymorphic transmembrane cluster 2 transmembrane protein 2, partial [Biomphalaria glabrata]
VPAQVSYSFFKYTDIVDYYSSNCTWILSLYNLKAGNYTLDISFYPNVTGIPDNINFRTTLQTSLLLTLPNISLSNECFDGINIVGGYIRPGSNATCICYLNKIGYPPAVLKWSNSMHTDLGTVINNTATALTI